MTDSKNSLKSFECLERLECSSIVSSARREISEERLEIPLKKTTHSRRVTVGAPNAVKGQINNFVEQSHFSDRIMFSKNAN